MYYNGINISEGQTINIGEEKIDLSAIAVKRDVQSAYDYPDWPVIIIKDGKPCPVFAEWGMVPEHIKSRRQLSSIRKNHYMTSNVHSKLLLSHKNYRDAALNGRCLVLSSHFFEFRYVTFDGENTKRNIPYCIGLSEQPLFFIAGVAKTWTDRETNVSGNFFAAVVTDPGNFMKKMDNPKNIQPTILTTDLAYKWLTSNLDENDITEIASFQLPDPYWAAYPVAKDYRKQSEPLTPFYYAGLPDL